jgi:pyruvate,water dikinase
MTIDKHFLYSGGLAEFVSKPSKLTFSFFRFWFTGKQSIGKAMALLKLPYCPTSAPILVLVNDEIYVNLKAEESTLYCDTMFEYKSQSSIHQAPKQSFDFKKILLPDSWNGTYQHIIQQSYWLSHLSEVNTFTQNLITSIPDTPSQTTIEDLDSYLSGTIWPSVISISVINEFFHAISEKDSTLQKQDIKDAISQAVIKQDWFFQSIVKMRDVKAGTLAFNEFIKEYGLRADKDYELLSPRWHEIPDEIKKRIDGLSHEPAPHVQESPTELSELAKTIVAMQVARVNIKRKVLIYFNALRQQITKKYSADTLSGLTRSEILTGEAEHVISVHIDLGESVDHPSVKDYGKGIGVSMGLAKGITQHINEATDTIHEGALCIFPKTSPEFSPYYKKCAGIIFMKGGVTSHGAIVAREYKIPAIVYNQTSEIPEQITVEIDGKQGTWKVA